MNHPLLIYPLVVVLFALGIGLQFVPLFQARLAPLIEKRPRLKIIRSRLFQLVAGFGILSLAIKLIQMV